MFQCGVCAFLAALCVIMGTVFYASRWPEKYRPMDFQGKYLNLGSSHQIWHVWLVISVIFVSLMYTGLADRLASFDKGSCHLNRTALAL
jgi:predicted membrane channel-forming protein YqfA (hemolysin III family)